MEQIVQIQSVPQSRGAASPASSLVEHIHDMLLSDSPDVNSVLACIESEMNLSQHAAGRMLSQLVAGLNASLFPPVTHLELIHTEGCNLACTYCFEKEMLGYRRMPFPVAQAAVDLLFEYSGGEPELHITHFGGEPTLNFRAIRDVTEYAEREAKTSGKSLNFDMTSNGVLFTEAMVGYFAQHNIRVLLSIDGLASTHDRYRIDKRGRGTFEAVLKGLGLLRKVQAWIGAKMTVMPANAGNMFEDVVGLHELGVNQFIIGYATGVKWSDEEIELYRDGLTRVFRWYQEARSRGVDVRIDVFESGAEESGFFGCQAGRVSITATVDGEISPCSKILALNKKQLLSKLGDVRYGLTHIRNRAELVSCNKLRGACEQKRIAGNFQGGCFAENYEDNHDLFQPSMQGHQFSIIKRSACSGCSAHHG